MANPHVKNLTNLHPSLATPDVNFTYLLGSGYLNPDIKITNSRPVSTAGDMKLLIVNVACKRLILIIKFLGGLFLELKF